MYNFIVHRFLGVPHRLNVVTEPASSQAHTTFVFIHGIGSSHKMWRKTQQDLRKQSRFSSVTFASVDLLGFGESPRPTWATYDTSMQAKSLHRTLRSIVGDTQVVLVGHSLGALVAVEYHKLYSNGLDALVLCSPPFYRQNTGRLPTVDSLLHKVYQELAQNSQRSEQALIKLQRYKLVNEGYSIDETNAPIFIKTLQSSIMNQTAYDDAINLTKPTVILSGILDPVVIGANIITLAKRNSRVKHKRIALAAHEINSIYRKELVKALEDIVSIIARDAV